MPHALHNSYINLLVMFLCIFTYPWHVQCSFSCSTLCVCSIFIFTFPLCNLIPSGEDGDQEHIRKNRSMSKENEEGEHKEEERGGQGKGMEKWKRTSRRQLEQELPKEKERDN